MRGGRVTHETVRGCAVANRSKNGIPEIREKKLHMVLSKPQPFAR